MTLADLLSEVRRDVQTDLPDAELIALFNVEQRDLATDLKVPRRTVEVSQVIGDFRLPDEAQYNALISCAGEHGRPVEVWTVAEADRLWPSWEGSGAWLGATPPLAVIYDPANVTTPLRPLPNPCSSSSLRITYALKPADLEALSDEPFTFTATRPDGSVARTVELSDTHQVLVYGVLERLMVRNNDNRASYYRARKDEMKEWAYAATRPAPVRARRHEHPFRTRTWR